MKKLVKVLLTVVILLAIVFASFLLVKKVFFESETGNDGIIHLRLTIGNDTKKEYFIDEDFSCPVVYLVEDGSLIDVSNSEFLSIEGNDTTTLGIHTVKITYSKDKILAEKEYVISVYSNEISSIDAVYTSKNIVYGESIDRNALSVYVNYKNGKRLKVDDYVLSYNSKTDASKLSVVVSYKDYKTSFDLDVVNLIVDEKYSSVEDDAIEFLKKIGIENPRCPKDYDFFYNIKNEGKIVIDGSFDDVVLTDIATGVASLSLKYFSDYTMQGIPEMSYDLGVESLKIVYAKDQTRCCLYITNLFNNYLFHADFSMAVNS